MPQEDMPTMRSRRLGGELRQLRTAAGLTVQEAADALECGHPKISQIETGRRGIRQIDLTLLLNLYGVEDDQYRVNLKRLAKEIHKVDWWSNAGPLFHDSLKDYLTLESDSQLVRSYENQVLPGLLQTEAYMRQVIAATNADRVDPLVNARLKRQEHLENQAGFMLRAIIDVPALHRIPGTREEVGEQIEHLLRQSKLPNVNIQVLPLDAALPINQWPPFTIFSLRGEPPADVVWLEHITGGTMLEQRQDVPHYTKTWDELTAAALSPAASKRYLRDLIKEA
ncbi:helix-turn-helix domain-containing protein [Streptomyces radicis]|uniref:XRE family transcriptional regulator n=1 Tax=Streptomyces radicis TaxID=1750517 RepID=A0A3A9WCB2_9ACTN|nr:helix-turn-helix transcriptional regulator [Streptomyces radicis]RKN05266.1 XRE family transcriptional regulator [Streptomyces radicis]RKN16799.1 XRE family transcriptional regulator [Streptomyces radicis]